VKAATYCRVSTDEQAQHGTSLETQREKTRAYIEERNWRLVSEFMEEGVSGAKESRPQLDRLLDTCRRSEVEVVVVTKHDRLARSLLNALLLMRDLDEMGVKVEFTDEPNETGLIRNLRFGNRRGRTGENPRAHTGGQARCEGAGLLDRRVRAIRVQACPRGRAQAPRP
jgi:DNA invertase Pin-like site-specific DNA recombinase